MSIESDAAKWKSNVSRIRELDPDGTVLNGSSGNIKKFFDEAASVFKKGMFDAENTKKQLKILRGRNTRLSGKPIAVELSSFINITERYATKTEDVFADFAKTLASNAQASANGNSARTSSRQRQVQPSRQEPLSGPLVHDNSSFCSGGDLAIHIIFSVFCVLEFIAGLFAFGIGAWIVYLLWVYTYSHCYMSKYPTLTRLGAIILPVPIVNIISIGICSLIGRIKYGNETFVEDGFDRKKEGLIFKIYTKLLFLNEPQFVKSGKYCEAYRVIRSYYVRNGFQESAMQDRCIAALEDGMPIIEAAQILHRITSEDSQFAIVFVESLLQIPRYKKVYNGAELVIREIAQIFGLSQEEYYDLLFVYWKRLSQCDPNFQKNLDQFKREYVAIKSRRRQEEQYQRSRGSYEEYSDRN
ncbi:hypothetical protein [Hallerella succinigenes]|uniref:Uncharacterized protein n=1 Tax=Hallerella succinigenes TaxID=1896222 RepID=A0A2M9A9F0_9BACT|nr:hypothetical protein [Hallerella succinigenes]PJJ42308.1 hypothetical protein BGX16_2333 [Hallerella succinigenes]